MDSVFLERRSVRKYSDVSVTKDELASIVKAGLLAPSSKNKRPWQCYVVTNRNIIVQMGNSKAMGSTFLSDAPAAIVVTGDETVSDVWIEDCSVVMSFMMIAAQQLGIGTCWCQIHKRASADGSDAEKVIRTLLGLSVSERIVGILGIGRSAFIMRPRTEDDVPVDKIHWVE